MNLEYGKVYCFGNKGTHWIAARLHNYFDERTYGKCNYIAEIANLTINFEFIKEFDASLIGKKVL